MQHRLQHFVWARQLQECNTDFGILCRQRSLHLYSLNKLRFSFHRAIPTPEPPFGTACMPVIGTAACCLTSLFRAFS